MRAGVDVKARRDRSLVWPIDAIAMCDIAATTVLAIVALVALATFRDYGLGWDDYTHSEYGDLLLSLYGSGFRDTRALTFVNLYLYGGGFDMAAALAAKVLPFDLFETRRLIGAAVGIVGLFATWRLGRRLGGPLAGLCALVLLATCPLYYGHMFMNAKDAPFAVAMIVLLLGLVRAIDEYPQPGPRAVVLVGVGLGLAFGSRILAAIAAPSAMAALLLILMVESRSIGLRPAIQRLWQFVGPMLPALALGYLIMGLLWPWAIQSPLNPLFASEHFASFFEKPWRELFAGKLYSVPDMPVSYLPQLFALKLPEIMLALGIAGFGGALAMAARPRAFSGEVRTGSPWKMRPNNESRAHFRFNQNGTRSSVPINRRAALLLVALAALLLIALALVVHPAYYNGLRQFVFVVPPFAV